MLKDKAAQYYNSGFSCSESIIKACIDEGLCPEEFLPLATSFSAGMSSGCLCGAVAASQMVSGYHFGRDNKFGNSVIAREKAAEFVKAFKERKLPAARFYHQNLKVQLKKNIVQNLLPMLLKF